MNPHESAARQEKASRLVETLVSAGANADAAAQMTDDQWMLAARIAGANPPSAVTKTLVVARLQLREEMARDPFAALKRKGRAA